MMLFFDMGYQYLIDFGWLNVIIGGDDDFNLVVVVDVVDEFELELDDEFDDGD